MGKNCLVFLGRGLYVAVEPEEGVFSLRLSTLPVPPEQKQAFDELLTRFCPVILATGRTRLRSLTGLDD